MFLLPSLLSEGFTEKVILYAALKDFIIIGMLYWSFRRAKSLDKMEIDNE